MSAIYYIGLNAPTTPITHRKDVDLTRRIPKKKLEKRRSPTRVAAIAQQQPILTTERKRGPRGRAPFDRGTGRVSRGLFRDPGPKAVDQPAAEPAADR